MVVVVVGSGIVGRLVGLFMGSLVARLGLVVPWLVGPWGLWSLGWCVRGRWWSLSFAAIWLVESWGHLLKSLL